ncbi:MAG: HPP family protein [Humidesulfovibrio sp.]|uniref:HPP family protein n=1 Tax=Humidesulfovibrio sp. TaxID=2910988 RepID=UPI0027338623|nr:HPP family protein [Humidesulfovibrio sp.]MDP2847597.1 HPP family protein [Humidesulfovibrio sp.]
MEFFAKMRGAGKSPPRVRRTEIVSSFLGSLTGIALLGWLHAAVADPVDQVLIIGSFAASAVLLFAAPKSPLAQPRNLLGGHVLSAIIGVSFRLALPEMPWLAAALAVATAIAVMLMTKTLHPPGGATAYIAVTGGPKIAALGYLYVLCPALTGAAILLCVALAANALTTGRRYPEYWW